MTDKLVGKAVSSSRFHRQKFVAGMSSFLSALDHAPDRRGPRGPEVVWTPRSAALVTAAMVLARPGTLAEQLADAIGTLRPCLGDPPGVGSSYNGLAKAMVRYTEAALPILKEDLRRRMMDVLRSQRRRSGGWQLLAVDGSKMTLPRTMSNEQAFGVGDQGVTPHALATVVVDVLQGIPWDWRIGPVTSSENAAIRAMIPNLPDDCLLVGDAAYVGYDLWEKLLAHGKHFLVRVGGNVSLCGDLFTSGETDFKLEQGIVYCWPRDRRDRPPLKLRLICVRDGGRKMHLITNVMDRRLTKTRAAKIFRLRWGAELVFRTLKKSLNRSKLQSREARRADSELQWVLVVLTIVALMGAAVEARRRHAVRFSFARAFAILRRAMKDKPSRCRHGPGAIIGDLLAAVQDSYERKATKRSRVDLRSKDTPKRTSLKPPALHRATADQKKLARRLLLTTDE